MSQIQYAIRIYVKPDDYIKLKSNLGEGRVTEVLQEPDPKRPEINGTYPMIQFKDTVTKAEVWCSYQVVQVHIPANCYAAEHRLGA